MSNENTVDQTDDTLGTSIETPETPDVEAEKTAPTMDDTLRAAYRELTAAPEEKPAEEEQKPDDRPRGPDGKFLPKEEAEKLAAKPVDKVDTKTEKASDAKTLKPADEKVPVEVAKAPEDPNLAKAPSSWSAKGQAKWAAADPEVRAEILKRENDFHKGLEGYKKEADLFKQIDSVIRPYEPLIRAAGTNAIAMIGDSLDMAYRLKTGSQEEKIQVLLNLASTYGADLTMIPTVQEKLSQGQPLVDPRFQQLQQQFTTLQESLQQREAREKQEADERNQAEMEAVRNELATWSATKPHYETVKLDMAALLESGRAKDFDDAYNKATWAHPDVRATLLAEQQAEQNRQAAERAAAAKKASSTNVKPRGTPPAKPANKVGTMDDTLREAYRKVTQA